MNPPAGHGQNGAWRICPSGSTGIAPQARNCHATATPMAITTKAPSVFANCRRPHSSTANKLSALPNIDAGITTAIHDAHSQIQNAGASSMPAFHPRAISAPCV